MSKAISHTLVEFTQALNNGEKCVVESNGSWAVLNPVMQIFTKLEWFEKRRLEKIAHVFENELDRLEKLPVDVSQGNSQKPVLDLYLGAIKAVKERIEPFKTSKELGLHWEALSYRTAALRYRMESVKPAEAPKKNQEEALAKLAEEWKESYDLYQDKALTDSEIAKIKEACLYPEFVDVISESKALKDFFFRWALRDNNSVDAFVQFPATCERLKSCLIAGRTGYFAKEFQWVQTQGHEKVLTLPFEVQEGEQLVTRAISILDESKEVVLRGGYKLTINKVMEAFRNKNNDVGCLEFLGKQGISNWHCHELGRWNPEKGIVEQIDLSEENGLWWEQLPVFETIDVEKAKSRYGIASLEQGQWVVVAKSTRESPSLDIDRSHGYLEVLIPAEEGYNVYPLGKFAKNFPRSLLQKAMVLANTVEARIQYPDENPYYSHRQQATAPYVTTEEKGKAVMESIRKDLLQAREGNIVFMFGWENCAFWPQQKLTEHLGQEAPNFFVAPAIESYPQMEPLKTAFNFCRTLPEKIKNVALRIVAFLMGSWRGMHVMEKGQKVFKSMMRSGFSKECEMYHPAYLHKRIQKQSIPGNVYLGHHFAPQMVFL